jgi:hypothetical protein
MMAGQVKARRQPLEAWSWAARGGRMWRDSAVAQLGSADAGWERELTGGAHASARGEREGAEDGRRESKKKNVFYEIRQRRARAERANEGNDGLQTRWAGAVAWAGWADFYRKNSKGFDF